VRILLDTGVLVRATAKARGPARELLLAIVNGPHDLIASPFLLNELERVLHYPRLQVRLGLSDRDIQEHAQHLRDISELVNAVVREPVVLTDPADDPIVYAAVEGCADVLCTLDRDFYEPEVIAFCQRHNITVTSDVDLLRRLRAEGK